MWKKVLAGLALVIDGQYVVNQCLGQWQAVETPMGFEVVGRDGDQAQRRGDGA